MGFHVRNRLALINRLKFLPVTRVLKDRVQKVQRGTRIQLGLKSKTKLHSGCRNNIELTGNLYRFIFSLSSSFANHEHTSRRSVRSKI